MKKLFVLIFLTIISQGMKAGSGDVNGDGLLTSVDVEILMSYIMTGTPEDIKLEVANVNDDSNIDVADLVLLLNKIIAGQTPWDNPVNTGLPVVFINTPEQKTIPVKTEPWLEETTIKIINPDGTVDYEENQLSIRERGNLTATLPKKPYSLKLSKSSQILGMNKHKRWCLLANWIDRTLLRNDVAFQIARQTQLDWTPTGKFVEVIMNGEHLGNYYLCEQVKVNKNRVNIKEMKAEDIEGEALEGGYLLELDVSYDEKNKFYSTTRHLPYMIQSPEEDILQPTQLSYITNYINTLESRLYASDWLEDRSYADMIDIGSFIDFWFVQELTMNSECRHPKSTFMYKDRGGKLKAGPVWDFDYETFDPDKTNIFTTTNNDKGKKHLYYERLFEDPAFVAEIKNRWAAYKADFDLIPVYIRKMAAYVKASNKLDFDLWPKLLEYGIPSTVNGDQDLTFDDAVERMITCYEEKVAWMDIQINEMNE